MTTTEASTLGKAFTEALAAKDFVALSDLLHPEIDFRGLTPHRNWEADNPDDVIQGILRVRNPDGLFEVEQQAYIAERDGRIGWMRALCSGFRPIA